MTGIHGGMLAAVKRPPIALISSVLGSTLSSGVTSVAFSGVQVGDFLIAAGGSQSTSDPTFTSGWTKACSYYSDNRCGIIVTKRAAATSETVTFTGSGTSSARYSGGIAFRNAVAVGNTGVRTDTGGTTGGSATSPALTMQRADGSSMVFLASYATGGDGITAAPNGLTISNGMAYGLRSSWTAGTVSFGSQVSFNMGLVELLN